MILSFDNCEIDAVTLEVRRAGKPVSVEPKVFDLLLLLALNRDRVVSRDEVIDKLWQGRTISDAALSTCVKAARRAIGDDGKAQRLIRTLQRRGFRFVGPVTDKGASRAIVQPPAKHEDGGRRAYESGEALAQSRAALSGPDKPLPLPDRPSIAVLPFLNISGDQDQEYFADGIVEDIITALSRFKSMFVIARNSSFTYKGKAVDIKQVGRELGVRYVLEGSVRNAAGRVRITGQLAESGSGSHLWADRFEGTMGDIFELQDRVTEQVVTAIAPRLTLAEIERTRLKRPESLDCYDHVLRAQSLLRPPTSTGLRAAIDHLHKAVELAPDYCLAHGLLAESYSNLDMIGDIREGEAQAAMHHAGLATRLAGGDDPESLAYASFAAACFDNVPSALALTEKALKLNPNLARAWSLAGFSAMYLAQHDRAIRSFERALRLNPMDARNATVMGGMATVFFLRKEYGQALACAEKGLIEMPSNMQCLRAMAMAAAKAGDYEHARNAAEKLRALYPRNLDRIRKMMQRKQDVERITEGLQLAGYTE